MAATQAARLSTEIADRPPRGAVAVYATGVALVIAATWFVSLMWWLLLPEARIVSLEVPLGTAAAVARGESPDVIPTTLLLRRGDTLAVRNEDDVVHRIGLYSIAPGHTERMVVDEAMLSGARLLCTIHPSGALSISALARPGIEATIIPTLIAGIPISFALVVAMMVIRRL